MRRVRFSVAMSLDGYIAGPNGESDWIALDPDTDFREFMGAFDTVLVGRKTSSGTPAARDGSGLMSVAPGFTANDANASIKWYCDVLGFAVKERWEHDGEFRGARITSGAVTINIGQDDWKLGRDRVKGQGTRIYIMTGPGIDQYANAIKARG